MRILITNDDGIDSQGLIYLARRAKLLGEVTVIAPEKQQSGTSHGIQIHEPIRIVPYNFVDDIRAFTVRSTPADCVRFGVLGLKEKFDLVLSGINNGYNLGHDIMYSATVGAVFEAASLGIKSVALSTDFNSFEQAKCRLDDIYEFFIKNKLFSFANLFNVNIPLTFNGFKITKQGGRYYQDEFINQGNNLFQPTGSCVYARTDPLYCDTEATLSGYISVTPLSLQRTDIKAYELLNINNTREHK